MRFLTAIAVLLLSVGTAEARSDDPLLISLDDENLAAVVEAVGWATGERTRLEAGNFSQTYFLSNGVPVQLEGLACEEDQLPGCPEYQLSVTYGVGSPARAVEVQAQLSYRWADVWLMAEDAIVVSRMEFLHGGVSRRHIEETFATFEQIIDDATAKAFPCGLPRDGVAPNC